MIGAIGLGVRTHRFLRRAIESDRFDVILTPYDYTLLRALASPVIDLAAARDLGVVNGSPYGPAACRYRSRRGGAVVRRLSPETLIVRAVSGGGAATEASTWAC